MVRVFRFYNLHIDDKVSRFSLKAPIIITQNTGKLFMKTERKQRVVHYKRAQFSTGDVTLQELLMQALSSTSSLNKACNRHEHLNQDSTECILINHHKTFNGMLFGQLIFIEYGKAQSF